MNLRALTILDWDQANGDFDCANGEYITFSILIHNDVPLHLRSRADDAYVVRRRFRQFAKLHEALKSEGYKLPDLPKVDVVTNILIKLVPDSALVERQDQLQLVLNAINESPEMQETDAYAEFIGQPPEMKPGYTSLSEYRSEAMIVPSTGRIKSASVA